MQLLEWLVLKKSVSMYLTSVFMYFCPFLSLEPEIAVPAEIRESS